MADCLWRVIVVVVFKKPPLKISNFVLMWQILPAMETLMRSAPEYGHASTAQIRLLIFTQKMKLLPRGNQFLTVTGYYSKRRQVPSDADAANIKPSCLSVSWIYYIRQRYNIPPPIMSHSLKAGAQVASVPWSWRSIIAITVRLWFLLNWKAINHL